MGRDLCELELDPARRSRRHGAIARTRLWRDEKQGDSEDCGGDEFHVLHTTASS